MQILYKNYRGEYAVRNIQINSMRIGSTEYHPQHQFLLDVWDLDKNAQRDYALKDCCFLSEFPVTDAMIGAAQAAANAGKEDWEGFLTDEDMKSVLEAALQELFRKKE